MVGKTEKAMNMIDRVSDTTFGLLNGWDGNALWYIEGKDSDKGGGFQVRQIETPRRVK